MRKILSSLLIALFLTACSEFHWITPEPSLLPTVTPTSEVIPAEEVGEVVPEPTLPPPCVVIKGNISRSGEKIFHAPGQANYGNVKIDESAGEAFFCSEQEALDAGFRKAQR